VFPLLPAVPALIAAAQQRGLKQAVVSNNSTADLPLILAQAGLADQFDLIIGNDVPDEQGRLQRKKPAPDFYLYACRQLGIAPQQAVVMEDSVLGATAGIAAGSHVIAVLTGSNEAADFQAMASPPQQIYPDFTQPPLAHV
jgi:HAD superfamily hydrolase (TIGR01509 family)